MIKRLMIFFANKTGLKYIFNRHVDFLINEHFRNRLGYFLREEEWKKLIKNKISYIDVFIINDILIRCYTNSLMGKLIYLEDFEQLETTFVNDFLEDGDIFIDIGANLGLFSLIASKKVGLSGHVYSFEPSPKIYSQLLENIELNNIVNIEAIPEALSDKDGYLDFNVYKEELDVFSSFVPILPDEKYEIIKVKTTRFKDFLQRLSIPDQNRVKLIKIDVEGWEIPVLRGFSEFLSLPNAPALLVEFTEENARACGYSCQELFDYVAKYGYTWFKIQGNELQKAKRLDFFKYQNLVALKKN